MFPDFPHNDFDIFNCISTNNSYSEFLQSNTMKPNTIGYFASDYLAIPSEEFYFIHNPVQSTFSKVDEYLSLNENWDGYNSIPLALKAGENAKKIVSCFNDILLENISDIFPNPHGTITFEWENNMKEKMSLEIGSNSYSYFVTNSNKKPKLVDGKDIFSDIGEITSEINNVLR